MDFEIREEFYLDGKKFKVISGAVHYFRIVPEYWRDRLEKLKNLGCNTVETYIPWNFHEPVRGSFLWDGMRNVCRFIDIAQELGLYLILRPSPYICAEWEFGGLPAWLLAQSDMRLRCSFQPYLDAVRDWWQVLLPKLAPYQINRGGRVIMMQIENEYGYYGDDIAYLSSLRDMMRHQGIEVPLVSSDGPWGKSFETGQLPDVLATGNFGSGAAEHFAALPARMQKKGPLMCMEFWVGWFDAWGQKEHKKSDLEQNRKDLEDILKVGSVNFYMFLGGTNFGFMNGTNSGSATGDVTSYDYDGILTEDGQITEKYRAFQQIIRHHAPLPDLQLSSTIQRKEFGWLDSPRRVDLFSALATVVNHNCCNHPLSMEEAGQSTGYLLYRFRMKVTEVLDEIRLEGAADRAQIFQDGRLLFTLEGGKLGEKFDLPEKKAGSVIDILVENSGRVNFGTGLEDQRKGITKGVRVNDHRHFGFELYPLSMDETQIASLDFSAGYQEGLPAFHEFGFEVDEPADTFVDFTRAGKGCIFINGFNLGRYWNIGPQKRLYLPGPLLRKGRNILMVFETEGIPVDRIFLAGEPRLE